jgi:epimerase transport system membrane fusion protein
MTVIERQTMSTINSEERADAFERGRRIGRFGALAIALLFGGTMLWLLIAPLNSAVIVPAQFVVEDYRKPVQHLEGGIVRRVLVRAGDKVTKGQVLVQLEEVQADSAVETLRDQLHAEEARAARADAERLLQDQLRFAPGLLERAGSDAKLQQILSAERELFQARRKQLLGQTSLMRDQAVQVNAEIAGLVEQMKSANVNRKLIADELAMNQALLKQEFVQQTRVMSFERALAEKDEKRGEYHSESAKAQQKLVELELRTISLKDDYVRRAADEYSEANRRVLELRERLKPVANALARQQVLAPVSGEVVDIKVHAAGTVIAPRDVLMEVVPTEHRLLLEGRVRPEDVAELSVGQIADVQVTAFNSRSTPLVTGTVSYVSADSLVANVGGTPAPYFQIQISVDKAMQAGLPKALSAGMSAVVFVRTRERTAMNYLLEPFMDSFRRSFTER